MECSNCNSKWETKQRLSAQLVGCPFCGASLDDGGIPKSFDNSKDVLAYIMRMHGVDILLGNSLKNYFNDYAPNIAVLRRNVVFSVSASGAAGILKSKITAKDTDKEIAFMQAVQKIVETHGTERTLVESVIRDFIDALGWQLSIQTPKHQHSLRQQQQQMVQTQINPQSSVPTQIQPIQQMSKDVFPEITQGKTRNLLFGGYKWRVLDVQSNRALLLTESVIEKRQYHNSIWSYRGVTWEGCAIRHYLNSEFLCKFSNQDQERILQVANRNLNNQWFDTLGGNITEDKVFLLSIEEVVNFFGDSGQLLKRNSRNEYWIDDKYNEERIAIFEAAPCMWWLRSPGYDSEGTVIVDEYGNLYMGGYRVNDDNCGVRPAIWVRTEENS